MAWLLQQNLPRIEIPTFNELRLKWVEFVIEFKEIVHNSIDTLRQTIRCFSNKFYSR